MHVRLVSGLIFGASAICSASFSTITWAKRSEGPRSVPINKPYDEKDGYLRPAADALIRGEPDMITVDKLKSGKVRRYGWFGAIDHHQDYLFFAKFNKFDDPNVCVSMMVEDGSYEYAGCVPATSPVVTRIFSKNFPVLRVSRNGKRVDYCYNGNLYVGVVETKNCTIRSN